MEKDVLPVHRSILALLDQLTDLQSNLYVKYREYLEKNKSLQVFGLDLFHYQCRLLDLELKQAQDHYAFLNNRMYCDYYKLYHMVRGFVKETFQLEPKSRTFPGYKDLEPYRLYEISDITLLYEDISDLLRKSMLEITKREKDLSRDIQERGLRLEQFIHHRTSNHAVLTTKVNLYEKYLQSYHIYHMSFLSNLLERVQLLFRQTDPVESKPVPMTNYLPADQKEGSNENASAKGDTKGDATKEAPRSSEPATVESSTELSTESSTESEEPVVTISPVQVLSVEVLPEVAPLEISPVEVSLIEESELQETDPKEAELKEDDFKEDDFKEDDLEKSMSAESKTESNEDSKTEVETIPEEIEVPSVKTAVSQVSEETPEVSVETSESEFKEIEDLLDRDSMIRPDLSIDRSPHDDLRSQSESTSESSDSAQAKAKKKKKRR